MSSPSPSWGKKGDGRVISSNAPPPQFCRVITDRVYLRGSEIAVFYHAARNPEATEIWRDGDGSYIPYVRVYPYNTDYKVYIYIYIL